VQTRTLSGETKSRSGTRRSQRISLRVPISVFEPGKEAKKFLIEHTYAVSVNLHGGLIALAASVNRGQRILIGTTATHEVKEARVVHLGPMQHGKRLIGIEFIEEAPDFWSVSFPTRRQ
jgi:hypothetical protein